MHNLAGYHGKVQGNLIGSKRKSRSTSFDPGRPRKDGKLPFSKIHPSSNWI